MTAGAGLLSQLIPNLRGATPAIRIPRRPFGKTGVQVPMVGFGGGERFYQAVPNDEAGGELVRQAIDHGIEYIETAGNYGPSSDRDCSERRIGLAMKTHRAKVFLETKLDARDYDGAMRSIENSLKQLQTDHIDFLLHHFLTRQEDLEKVLGPNGAEKAIRKMKDQKVVRFRGFSCHLPQLALEALPRIEPDGVQFTINATRVPDFEAEVLPYCKSHGIAVNAMKTCGHGFFTKGALQPGFDYRGLNDKHPEEHRYAPPAEAFERTDLPTLTEFLCYALSLPLTTAVVGMESMPTVEGVLQGVAGFKVLSAADMQSIHERSQPLAGTGDWVPRGERPA
jgi:aryl-alcohol dehydrogenase-like predicted oxidoreductase